MFKVTYNGDGVASNKLGAFQNGTTAFTSDEKTAREIASEPNWSVTAPDGTSVGAPRAETHAEPAHAAVDLEFGRRPEKHKKPRVEDAKPQD